MCFCVRCVIKGAAEGWDKEFFGKCWGISYLITIYIMCMTMQSYTFNLMDPAKSRVSCMHQLSFLTTVMTLAIQYVSVQSLHLLQVNSMKITKKAKHIRKQCNARNMFDCRPSLIFFFFFFFNICMLSMFRCLIFVSVSSCVLFGAFYHFKTPVSVYVLWHHRINTLFYYWRIKLSDCRCSTATSYLFIANTFVCVVQLVGEDLSVAGERLVPAQRDRRRWVGHSLQVWSRTGHLDWWQNRAEEKIQTFQIRALLNLTNVHRLVPTISSTSKPRVLMLPRAWVTCCSSLGTDEAAILAYVLHSWQTCFLNNIIVPSRPF